MGTWDNSIEAILAFAPMVISLLLMFHLNTKSEQKKKAELEKKSLENVDEIKLDSQEIVENDVFKSSLDDIRRRCIELTRSSKLKNGDSFLIKLIKSPKHEVDSLLSDRGDKDRLYHFYHLSKTMLLSISIYRANQDLRRYVTENPSELSILNSLNEHQQTLDTVNKVLQSPFVTSKSAELTYSIMGYLSMEIGKIMKDIEDKYVSELEKERDFFELREKNRSGKVVTLEDLMEDSMLIFDKDKELMNFREDS